MTVYSKKQARELAREHHAPLQHLRLKLLQRKVELRRGTLVLHPRLQAGGQGLSIKELLPELLLRVENEGVAAPTWWQ